MPDRLAGATGMRVDAAGRVTYDFEGHVHAKGLDLDASPVDDQAIDNMVRWLRKVDREQLVRHYSWELGAGVQHAIEAFETAGDTRAGLYLLAGLLNGVSAKAGIWETLIIDEDRKSAFAQVMGTNVSSNRGLRISREFAADVAVAPGTNDVVNVGLGVFADLGFHKIVVGHLTQEAIGDQWIDHVSWSVTGWPGDNSVNLSFACNSDALDDAIGGFLFRVITGD